MDGTRAHQSFGEWANCSVNCITEPHEFVTDSEPHDQPGTHQDLPFDETATHLPPDLAPKLTGQLIDNKDRFTSSDLEKLGDHDEHIHPVKTGDNKANSDILSDTTKNSERNRQPVTTVVLVM